MSSPESGRYASATSATLAGILNRFRAGARIGTLVPDDRLDGKHCLVTGGTAGLGHAVARGLYELGASVVLTGRNLRPELLEGMSERATLESLDLSRLENIPAFVRRQERPFDLVVSNAGLVSARARKTSDGFDEMLQVNFLSALFLIGQLIQQGRLNEGGRIVIVSSESHRSAEVDLDNFGEFRPYGVRESVSEYGRTKLLLCTFAHGLASATDGGSPKLAVHALCPGAVDSSIAREAPSWSRPLLSAVFSAFFRSPEQAREPVLYLAAATAIEGRTGIYLHLMEQKGMAPAATDDAAFARLLRRSRVLLARAVPEEQLAFFDAWTSP